MPEIKYEAPKLTKYGKLNEFIQAGSVLNTGDVTGDGVPDTLFDTDGDGIGDVLVGGANGGRTNVSLVNIPFGPFINIPGYDADGDGLAGFFDAGSFGGSLTTNLAGVDTSNIESPEDDGLNDPARD